MALSLEELKRQRAQIEKHLDWLDAAIAELEPPKAGEGKPATTPAGAALPSAPSDSGTGAGTETEAAKVPKKVPKAGIESHIYQSKTHDELRQARIGCFLFFVLGIVLFLFLLFGLPYYL